jgi:hypothetical protein
MRLTMLQIREGERIPWWGRPWRYDFSIDSIDVLPIPICWLARLGWNLWCATYKVRLNAFERVRQDVWRAGYEAGIDVGMVKGGHREAASQEWIAETIALRARAQVCEEFLKRVLAISNGTEDGVPAGGAMHPEDPPPAPPKKERIEPCHNS